MNSRQNKIKNSNYAYIVPAIDRAAQILALIKENGRGMTITEVTEATGWHKSSIHKLLVTLNHHGLLDRDEATKQYSLGIALIGYGQYVMNHLNIRQEVRSILTELSDLSGETANFSLLNANHIVNVQSVESNGDLRVIPPIGTMDTLTRKSNGKVVLASLPEEQAIKIIQREGLPTFTKNSITTIKGFQKELAMVREQGYATDFEEFQDGINAVSAPVSNIEGRVIGSLSVVGPALRMSKYQMHSYGKECVKKADRLSELLRLLPDKSESNLTSFLQDNI